MRITPKNDHILVVEEKLAERVSAGGIILPASVSPDGGDRRGVVVACGPGKLLENGYRVPMAVKVGDLLSFGKYAGVPVKIEGVDHHMITQEDVFGVVEG